jgi:hypothetical protein
VDKGAAVAASSSAVKIYHNVNNDTGTHFLLRRAQPSSATTTSLHLPLNTATAATPCRSRAPFAQRAGREDLVADYSFDGQHLVYSTSEVLTRFALSNRAVLALYGRTGRPARRCCGTVAAHGQRRGRHGTRRTNATTGDLRLNYSHTGITQVVITGGGRTPISADRQPERGGQYVAPRQPRAGARPRPGAGTHGGVSGTRSPHR